jgi:hypothetical protein
MEGQDETKKARKQAKREGAMQDLDIKKTTEDKRKTKTSENIRRILSLSHGKRNSIVLTIKFIVRHG